MTERRSKVVGVKERFRALYDSFPVGACGFELTRTKGGAVLFADGILVIKDLSDRLISFTTHSGKVNVRGTGLALALFDDRKAKIYGKIEGVELDYGKRR